MNHVLRRSCFRFLTGLVFLLQCFSSPVYSQIPSSRLPGFSPAEIRPAALVGLQYQFDKPFQMNFMITSPASGAQDDYPRLIRYFLTALSVDQKDLWVNLSPLEPDRVLPPALTRTELGQGFLEADYRLKQLVNDLLSPENPAGEKFWNAVFESSGSVVRQDVETFNKVWIVPDQAEVEVWKDTAVITRSRLKVMLDADYRLMKDSAFMGQDRQQDILDLMRRIILPEIEERINTGEDFAPLRQMFAAMILAVWFKTYAADSALGHNYVNQEKLDGFHTVDPSAQNMIYERYVRLFQQSQTGDIRDAYDPQTQQVIPRKYVTGGILAESLKPVLFTGNRAMMVDILAGSQNVAVQLEQTSGGSIFSQDFLQSVRQALWGNFLPNGAIVAGQSKANPNYFKHWQYDATVAARYFLKVYQKDKDPELKIRLKAFVKFYQEHIASEEAWVSQKDFEEFFADAPFKDRTSGIWDALVDQNVITPLEGDAYPGIFLVGDFKVLPEIVKLLVGQENVKDLTDYLRHNMTIAFSDFDVEGQTEGRRARRTSRSSPQKDGPALSVIFFVELAEVLKAEGDEDYVQGTLLPLIQKDTDYLLRFGLLKSYDRWEETEGFHFHTRFIMRRALMDAVGFFERSKINYDQEKYGSMIQTLDALIRKDHLKYGRIKAHARIPALIDKRERGRFWKRKFWDVVDILAQLYYSRKSDIIRLSSPGTMHNIAVIENFFASKPNMTINLRLIQADLLEHGLLIGRYGDDPYTGLGGAGKGKSHVKGGGNPWMMLTIAFAQYYHRLAEELMEQKSVSITRLNKLFFQRRFSDMNWKVGDVITADDPRFAFMINRLLRIGDNYLKLASEYFLDIENGQFKFFEQINGNTGQGEGTDGFSWVEMMILETDEYRQEAYQSWRAFQQAPASSSNGAVKPGSNSAMMLVEAAAPGGLDFSRMAVAGQAPQRQHAAVSPESPVSGGLIPRIIFVKPFDPQDWSEP